MSNQASEDTLTYGVDRGIPGGDFTALSIKKGSTLYTFVGGEAVAIIDVIRTEKLKLLNEVRERVVGEGDFVDAEILKKLYDKAYSHGYNDKGYENSYNSRDYRSAEDIAPVIAKIRGGYDKRFAALTKLEAEQ